MLLQHPRLRARVPLKKRPDHGHPQEQRYEQRRMPPGDNALWTWRFDSRHRDRRHSLSFSQENLIPKAQGFSMRYREKCVLS
jgi:hypothetical protein